MPPWVNSCLLCVCVCVVVVLYVEHFLLQWVGCPAKTVRENVVGGARVVSTVVCYYDNWGHNVFTDNCV